MASRSNLCSRCAYLSLSQYGAVTKFRITGPMTDAHTAPVRTDSPVMAMEDWKVIGNRRCSSSRLRTPRIVVYLSQSAAPDLMELHSRSRYLQFRRSVSGPRTFYIASLVTFMMDTFKYLHAVLSVSRSIAFRTQLAPPTTLPAQSWVLRSTHTSRRVVDLPTCCCGIT